MIEEYSLIVQQYKSSAHACHRVHCYLLLKLPRLSSGALLSFIEAFRLVMGCTAILSFKRPRVSSSALLACIQASSVKEKTVVDLFKRGIFSSRQFPGYCPTPGMGSLVLIRLSCPSYPILRILSAICIGPSMVWLPYQYRLYNWVPLVRLRNWYRCSTRRTDEALQARLINPYYYRHNTGTTDEPPHWRNKAGVIQWRLMKYMYFIGRHWITPVLQLISRLCRFLGLMRHLISGTCIAPVLVHQSNLYCTCIGSLVVNCSSSSVLVRLTCIALALFHQSYCYCTCIGSSFTRLIRVTPALIQQLRLHQFINLTCINAIIAPSWITSNRLHTLVHQLVPVWFHQLCVVSSIVRGFACRL